MIQYPKKDLDIYVRRLHERAMDYCGPVVNEVLMDFYIHSVRSKTEIS